MSEFTTAFAKSLGATLALSVIATPILWLLGWPNIAQIFLSIAVGFHAAADFLVDLKGATQ